MSDSIAASLVTAEQPVPIRGQPRWTLWAWWVVANGIGGLAGQALGIGAGKLLSLLYGNAIMVFPTAIVIWLCLALGQWLVVRRYLIRVERYAGAWWTLSSVLASILVIVGGMYIFFIAFSIQMLLIDVMTPGQATSLGDYPVVARIIATSASSVILGAWGGVVVGSAQWLILQTYFRPAVIWIWINAAAWAIGLMVVTVASGGNSITSLPLVVSFNATSLDRITNLILSTGAMAAIASAITGLALMRLLRQSIPPSERKPLLSLGL